MRSLATIAGYVQGIRFRSFAFGTLAAVATVVSSGTPVQAGYVISGGSAGAALSTNLNVNGLLGVNVGLNALAATAPAAYNDTLTPASGSAGLTGVLGLSTGLLNTTISSGITSGATTGSTNGSTTINNLNTTILNLLTITAGTLTTTATASGTSTGAAGSLTASSTAAVTNLKLFVGGFDVTAQAHLVEGSTVDVSAILGTAAALVNIKIGLDLKSVTGDGSTFEKSTSDNLLITISVLGGVNGTIDIGHSEAYVAATAVPEPSSIAMVVLGLGLTGTLGLRRNGAKGRMAQAGNVA